uniref:Aminopeptidase N-like N-terminal domain-containing protein n=1 Tax=Ditylenchus dipsaci TaxID=166011 RepID=A0A915DKD1_9BILA
MPPDKMLKSKSSMIAITLAGLSLLVICLIAIWLLISGASRKSGISEMELASSSSDNFTESPNSDLSATSSTRINNNATTLNPVPSVIVPSQKSLATNTITSTMSSIAQETLPSKTTTEITLPSTAKPINEVTMPTRAQHVPFCEFPADFKSSCPQIRQSTTNDKSNTFLQNSLDHLLSGSLDLLFEVLKEGNSIALHAGRNIRFIEQNQISIWICNEGEKLCPKSITRILDKQLLVIGLEKTLQPRTAIRLKIGKFESEIASNPGLTSQIPSKWEKDRAWIVSSYNLENGSRLVYPGVDEDDVMATLKLCIKHPKETFARSNMPQRSAAEESSWTSTCFHETPSINTKHFAFLLFDNLKLLTGTERTNVEVFVGKHLQPENCQWIIEETFKTLQKIASMTSMAYPLEKLTIVSVPLATDATHSYGLIQIKDTMFEYPKYFEPHSLLTSQVVQQWISNIITICDKCIQVGNKCVCLKIDRQLLKVGLSVCPGAENKQRVV